MHRWPEHPLNEFTTSWLVISTLQSGMATRWFLAPPSASTFLFRLRARLDTSSATWLEPTNVTAATSSWSMIASTATLSPLTT